MHHNAETVLMLMHTRRAELICGPSGWYLTCEGGPAVSNQAASTLVDNGVVILCDTRRGAYRLSMDGLATAQSMRDSRQFIYVLLVLGLAAIAVVFLFYLLLK